MAPSSRSSTYATELGDRMRLICAELTFSEVARRTDTNRETVRRYISSGRPSAEFVARLCQTFGVSGTWLLTGRGPRYDSYGSRASVHTRARAGAILNGRRNARSRRAAPAS